MRKARQRLVRGAARPGLILTEGIVARERRRLVRAPDDALHERSSDRRGYDLAVAMHGFSGSAACWWSPDLARVTIRLAPFVSSRLVQHDLVDSTNERALAAIAAGSARHGDVHVAQGQSAGRGRLGRSWVSARGEGLYLSLVLLPSRAPNPAGLTMGAGLAVLESVRALGVREALLKWPNDVLAPDKGRAAKLAGILVESRGPDPARPHAVVGVGLNVLQREFPPELAAERAVTSLALLGLDASRERALDVVLAHLAPRLELACREPERIAADYARESDLLGRAVRIRRGTNELTGRLESLTVAGLGLALDGVPTLVPLEHAQSVEVLD